MTTIAGQYYAYNSGWGKLQPQKRFGKTIKFKPVSLIRPDSFYIFNIEEFTVYLQRPVLECQTVF
jgi:hypothetical protein